MKKLILITLVSCMTVTSTARAEDIQTIFQRVKELSDKQNYSKALEEISWMKKEIETMHMKKIQGFFPDQVLDFTAGKAESNSTLGFTNVERTYKNSGTTIKASLTGAGNSAGGLGGLAQLGKMAAMFGGQGTGQDTVRIAGRTATLETKEGGSGSALSVFLDSGSILRLDLEDGADSESLKKFAEALKLEELDSYLKG